MGSKGRCNAINVGLWHISRPAIKAKTKDRTKKVFTSGVLDDGTWIMYIDRTYKFYVDKDVNLNKLTTQFPDLSKSEKDSLTEKIMTSNSFTFDDIIPSTTTVYTMEEYIGD